MSSENKTFKAFCIAGVSSGSGKTSISLGLMRALKRRGFDVQPYKCGPDYIDPSFHSQSAGNPSVNLDLWICGRSFVKETFASHMREHRNGIAVVEGVMSLFDGANPESIEGSTADIAMEIDVPVFLVFNAKGMGGSAAALIKGFHEFLPGLRTAGVIANFVSSQNHAEVIRKALDFHKLPPLVGAIPANPEIVLPERHLGLVPSQENYKQSAWYDMLADFIEKHIDIDKLLELADKKNSEPPREASAVQGKRPKLGIAMDEAFHFYYQDNLTMLEEAGIELVKFSPVNDSRIPEGLDGIYIGGGFPELFAEQIASNDSMKESIRNFSKSGKTVYAECGGLIYLSKWLFDGKQEYPFCGLFDFGIAMGTKLQALGYRNLEISEDCILGKAGMKMKAHEFHWSFISEQAAHKCVYNSKSAKPGAEWTAAGFEVNGNTVASYAHIHFASNPELIQSIKGSLS